MSEPVDPVNGSTALANPIDDMPESGRTQRASAEEVKQLVERLIPEEACRLTVLHGLADAIDAAHGVGATRWAVTINRQEIRLNVGSYVAYAITKGGIWLSLETKVLPPDLLPQLRQRTDWSTETFRSYPSSATPLILCDQLDDILPLIREAHDAFIRTAAAQVSQVLKVKHFCRQRSSNLPVIAPRFRW